jgi:hypothetical protein
VKQATKRRAWLVGAVVALGLFNLAFAVSLLLKGQQNWVVRYPALEAYQRSHPDNLLFGSDHWDERVPVSSAIDPRLNENPSMLRDILSCKPRSVIMEWTTDLPQMPVRFYLSGERPRSSVERCVRKRLPSGYVIERVMPSRS